MRVHSINQNMLTFNAILISSDLKYVRIALKMKIFGLPNAPKTEMYHTLEIGIRVKGEN